MLLWNVHRGGALLKRLALIALLVSFLIPGLAMAKEKEDHDKDDIRATEMVGTGIAAAGLIGLAGYLFLRRRTARN